jgi:hypothetical protein
MPHVVPAYRSSKALMPGMLLSYIQIPRQFHRNADKSSKSY